MKTVTVTMVLVVDESMRVEKVLADAIQTILEDGESILEIDSTERLLESND